MQAAKRTHKLREYADKGIQGWAGADGERTHVSNNTRSVTVDRVPTTELILTNYMYT